MKKIQTHKMAGKPYDHATTPVGKVPLYKSLCGIREPMSQSHGMLPVTCRRCLKIDRMKSRTATEQPPSPKNARNSSPA